MVKNASKPRPVHVPNTAVPFPPSTTATATATATGNGSSPLTPSSSYSTMSTWTTFSTTSSHGSPPQCTDANTNLANTPPINVNATAPAQGNTTSPSDLSVSTGPHHRRWFPTKLNTPPLSPVDVGDWTTSAATITSSSATTSRTGIPRARSPSAPNPLAYTTSSRVGLTVNDPTPAGTKRSNSQAESGSSSTYATPGRSWPIEPQHYEARPYPEARSYLDYYSDHDSFAHSAYQSPEYLVGHADEPYIHSTPLPRAPPLRITTLAHHHSQPNLHLPAPPSNGRPLSYVNESDEGSGSVAGSGNGSGSDGGRAASLTTSKSHPTLRQSSSGKNVFINSVRAHATEEMLEKHAAYFGEVYSCRIQPVGREPLALHANGTAYQETPQRRCAFVLYKKVEQAAAFIAYLRDHGILCDVAKDDFQTEWKIREDRESSNLYCQGLPLEITKEEVCELFEPYGKVASLKFLESSDRQSRRGPILARLESRAQAEAAIKGLNGKPYRGDMQHILQIRIADSNEQKEYKQRTQRMLHNAHTPVSSLGRDGSHRLSVPDLQLLAAEHAALRDEREKLQQALAQILAKEERLAARLAHRPYSPRQLYQMHGPAVGDYDPYITPPRSATGHHRPSLSSTMRSERSWSSSTYGGSIWTPPRHVTTVSSASNNDSEAVRRVRFEANLHHARSTPDLGKGEEGVRLLWKNDDRAK